MVSKLNYTKTLRDLGISYLGSYSQSMKMRKSYENGTVTYCVYLAPWNMSGHNVCPGGLHCHKFCLNGSGQNKLQIFSKGFEQSHINKARIKRTKLFYDNNELFMRLMIHEIRKTQKYAEKHNMGFSVRINATSDISPEKFIDPDTGLNLLQLFPNVQFYDYTKVITRLNLLEKYPNYYLVFSYDGHNIEKCKYALEHGVNVAVVFSNQQMLPMKFMGYNVVDGNQYDMRYLDEPNSIVGLHYHTTAANYDKNGKYIEPDEDFVIRDDNEMIEWYAD